MPKKNPKRIGLAIVGGGRIGLIRGEIAKRHPQVDWIGLAEKNPERAKLVAEKIGADFVTGDHRELLARPEATAAIIATDEHLHVAPIMAALERKLPLFIEKPLATELGRVGAGPQGDPAGRRGRGDRVHAALPPPLAGGEGEGARREPRRRVARHLARVHEPAGRARQLPADQRSEPDLADGDLGHARARHRDVDDGGEDTGRDLRPLGRQGARARCGGIDATVGTIAFADGALYHAAISWALPVVWPGAVYSLEVGIVGTERRADDRRHAPRHRARDVEIAGRRLRARPVAAGRLPHQLSAGRHRARRAARADARGDRVLAQPPRPRPADAARDRGRRRTTG